MTVSIRLEHVEHEYGGTEESSQVHALSNVDLALAAGDFAILMGPSGSGKSTLLNLIGAVDRPTSGRILIGDTDIAGLSEDALTLFRRTSVGFIFQFFNLVPTLTVRENIGFPLALAGMRRKELDSRTGEILEGIGLQHRAGHYPNQLSGGEMQRVAIGRAIVHRPAVLLADEPTGNLDSRTGETVLELIRSVHRSYRPTIVMATHSERAASYGDYIRHVIDGRVLNEGPAE
ncbi:MAG TPA: ABC transporter ATP-binding protein [Thermoanaerobaculia bacterium]|nr:ABC transporter ATP-binding protein [Thermoanaerobaculia bacterium]